jgi:hypothetical protein
MKVVLAGCRAQQGSRRPPLSRSEASIDERSWARQDSRDVTRRCCAIFGAGRVRCVAACGVPARSGLPRHRLPSGRLPRVPSRPRRARANGRAREQRRGCAGGRVSGMGADPAGLARRWSGGVRAHPAARGGVPAFPRGKRDWQVASACGVVMGMPAVLSLLPEHRPASAGDSSEADCAVGAAARRRRDRADGVICAAVSVGQRAEAHSSANSEWVSGVKRASRWGRERPR